MASATIPTAPTTVLKPSMVLPPTRSPPPPLSAPALPLDACLPWLRLHIKLPEAIAQLDPADRLEAERNNRILLASSIASFVLAGMASYLEDLERDVTALTESAVTLALNPTSVDQRTLKSRAAVAASPPVFRQASSATLVELRRINVKDTQSAALQSSEARWPFPTLQTRIEGRGETGAPTHLGQKVDISTYAFTSTFSIFWLFYSMVSITCLDKGRVFMFFFKFT